MRENTDQCQRVARVRQVVAVVENEHHAARTIRRNGEVGRGQEELG